MTSASHRRAATPTGVRALAHLCLIVCATLLLEPTPGHAETSADDNVDVNVDVEQMVVTAHRIPLAKSRIGSAVTSIDAQTFEQRQRVFATDVLRDVPGVAISRTAGYGSLTQVRIRGAEANQVLVLIDGVEANDPALGDEFDFTSLMSYDIDNVEVLRGPQSALWGSDATAGVINITTRTGGDGLDSSAFVEYGSQSSLHGGGRASWNGARGGVSLNGAYYDSDGDSAASAGKEDDGFENLQLSMTARLAPTDSSQLKLFSRYSDGKSEYDGIDFSTGLPDDADNESDDELLLMGLSGSLSLLDGSWDQELRLTYLDSDHAQSSDGLTSASSAAEKTGVYYQSTFKLPDWGRLARQHLILAIDYEDEDFKQRGEGFPGFDPNQDQSLDNSGYVAEYLVEPLEQLSLSASMRYDSASDFDDVTTYRFTSSYLLPRFNTRLHASAGKSQKSPTFTERFGFFPDQFLGNPDLEPEKNKGFDVGVEQRFAGGRVSVDLTYFSERLEDEINPFVFDADSGLFTAANLDRRSKRDGVEVDVDGRLTEDLRVGLTYTYTDSREPEPAGGRARELRRPRHTAAATLNQRLLDGRGNINVNLSYVSEQRDRFFPPFPQAPETVKLGSYRLLSIAGSFQLTRQLAVYARVENLGDESYENVLGFQAPQRSVMAGLRLEL